MTAQTDQTPPWPRQSRSWYKNPLGIARPGLSPAVRTTCSTDEGTADRSGWPGSAIRRGAVRLKPKWHCALPTKRMVSRATFRIDGNGDSGIGAISRRLPAGPFVQNFRYAATFTPVAP